MAYLLTRKASENFLLYLPPSRRIILTLHVHYTRSIINVKGEGVNYNALFNLNV